MTRFESALNRVLRWEGGLVNNPADPGGWTNYGISLPWLESQGVDVDGNGRVDAEDIKNLSRAKAAQLYRSLVWDVAYDQLSDDAVAGYVFDMEVNMGQRRAHLIAQRAALALGASLGVDGTLGPKSVTALNSVPPAALLAKMRELRRDFYRNLVKRKPALGVFLAGWLRRAGS